VNLSCWMSGISMAIPIRPQGEEGAEGILLYPIRGNLSNCERGLRVFYHTQQGEIYDKARHTI
jgi:hypothetical protein